MTHRSKSTLFLIEQLIVIAVFAICAAACISILTAAYFYTVDSKATDNALIKAQSAAEIFKATGGDFGAMTSILGGAKAQEADEAEEADMPLTIVVSSMVVFYDSDWRSCGFDDAVYLLSLTVDSPEQFGSELSLATGLITVSKVSGGELISFPLAARVKEGAHYG